MSPTVVAVNGSPRKNWNTATLLGEALRGAASRGADTRLVHLYDLDFKGCISCFACKLAGGPSYGRCVVRDSLTPILDTIAAADALIIGSPLYFGSVTGQTRSFLERLLFPYIIYIDAPSRTLFPRRIPTALLYTMNVTADQLDQFGWQSHLTNNERFLGLVFGAAESLYCYDTLQFDDYSRYIAPKFDPVHKARRRAEAFPADLRQAFQLGEKFAAGQP